MDSLTEAEKIVLEVERIALLIEKDRQREIDRKKAQEERKEWEEKHLRKVRRQ